MVADRSSPGDYYDVVVGVVVCYWRKRRFRLSRRKHYTSCCFLVLRVLHAAMAMVNFFCELVFTECVEALLNLCNYCVIVGRSYKSVGFLCLCVDVEHLE